MRSSFVAFDGEGVNVSPHEYILLADSTGRDLRGSERDPITWERALPFLMRPALRETFNVWFAFNYDINMLGKHEPKAFQEALYREGEADYSLGGETYHLTYLPRKILKIKAGRQSWTHYDVWGFFQASFLKALEQWKIDAPDLIAEGKLKRSAFSMTDMDFMVRYNAQECALLVRLMDALNAKLAQVGITLRSWHGAGAIASEFLKAIHARDHYPRKVTMSVHRARLSGYFGGRIELCKRGEFSPVYSYDINSCYPSALLTMPSLRDKKWKRVSGSSLSPSDYGLVDVAWDLEQDFPIAPLPFREENAYVRFPLKGSGTYYNSEVQAALRFIRKWQIEGTFKLGTGLLLEKPYEYPYRDYIVTRAKERLKYKAEKDFAHIPLKLGLNALYGKTAQRPTKTTRRLPQFRELLVAGHITAHGRSELLDACVPEETIMFATDSVKSLVPLDLPISEALGEWEFELWPRATFVLSGVYGYEDPAGKWHDKTRGYHELDVRKVYAMSKRGDEVRAFDRQFIGVKKGLMQPKAYPEMCRFWEIDRVINWDNNSKRSYRFDDYSLPALALGTTSTPYSDKFQIVEDMDDDNAL